MSNLAFHCFGATLANQQMLRFHCFGPTGATSALPLPTSRSLNLIALGLLGLPRGHHCQPANPWISLLWGLLGLLCFAIIAMESLLCDLCHEIFASYAVIAMQSLLCNHCYAFIAMQSLLCNHCHALFAVQSLLCRS